MRNVHRSTRSWYQKTCGRQVDREVISGSGKDQNKERLTFLFYFFILLQQDFLKVEGGRWMFKESGQKSVLIHRKSLSKEKNENFFIPSLLNQETWTGKKIIIIEILEPVKHANRICFISNSWVYQGSQRAWAKAVAGGAPAKRTELEPSWSSERCHGAAEAGLCSQQSSRGSELTDFEAKRQLSVLWVTPEMDLAPANSRCLYLKVGISPWVSLSISLLKKGDLRSLLSTLLVLLGTLTSWDTFVFVSHNNFILKWGHL